MRNPIRLKNLQTRFVPAYLLLGAGLWLARPDPCVFATGASLVVLGAGVRAWGAGHLVKTDSLTLTGPYGYLRHPLYLGTLLAGVGFCLLVGGGPGALLAVAFCCWFFLAYFPRKEAAESGRLLERYGDSFRHYRCEVRALWPSWRPFRGGPGRRWSFARFSENNELGTTLALAVGLALFALRSQ